MIKRFFAGLLLFLIFVLFEFSFIHALPFPFLAVPFVVALSIYLVQHLGSATGVYWLAGYGLWLDAAHAGNVPLETFAFSVAALASLYFSRRLFSNRSIYGVLACAVFVSATFIGAECLILVWRAAIQGTAVAWQPYVTMVLWQIGFLIGVVTVLFYSARRVAFFFQKVFILTKHS